ncbi:MAG: hypothetical protein KGZ43_02095 [Sulfuritalea sp.]|nr:hypothetical protein [Sulfuritalea sp.]
MTNPASGTLPRHFLRGVVATGLLAALQDRRRGADLLRSALLGGTALSAAVGVENLVFDKERKLGKKKKGLKKGGLAGLDRAQIEALLAQREPTGLAALTGSQQFLLGALIGAGAAYVLADEALRAKLIRGGLELYTGVLGGIEEMKEQVADIQAEMAGGISVTGGRDAG